MLNISKYLTKNFEKLSLNTEDTKTNHVGNGFYETYIIDKDSLSQSKKIIEFNQNLRVKDKETHTKNYFGAFINTDYMENKDMIKLGIPKLTDFSNFLILSNR